MPKSCSARWSAYRTKSTRTRESAGTVDIVRVQGLVCARDRAVSCWRRYLYARDNVKSSSPQGTRWSRLSACAPNNVSLTPLGMAWAIQTTQIYFDGFKGGVVQDCAGAYNSWQGLTAPAGAAAPAGIAGSDSAAVLRDKDGHLWERTGITPTTPQGSGWRSFATKRAKAVALTPSNLAWVIYDDGSLHSLTQLQRNGGNASRSVSCDGLPPAAEPVAVAANDAGDLLLTLSDGQLFRRNGIDRSSVPTGTGWESVASGVASAAVDSTRNIWLALQNGTVLMATFAEPRTFVVVSSTAAAGPRCDHITASMGQLGPSPQSPLLPRPASENDTGQVISLDLDTFKFSIDASSLGKPDVVALAFERYGRILRKTVQHSVPAAFAANTSGACTGLTVVVHDTTTAPRPTAEMDESYSLIVGAPTARLVAPSAWGALRGLETFSQLVQRSAGGEGYQVAAGTITDRPEYSYRGLMVSFAYRHQRNVSVQFGNAVHITLTIGCVRCCEGGSSAAVSSNPSASSAARCNELREAECFAHPHDR